MISRRGVLGGLGALCAAPAWAFNENQPRFSITTSHLTQGGWLRGTLNGKTDGVYLSKGRPVPALWDNGSDITEPKKPSDAIRIPAIDGQFLVAFDRDEADELTLGLMQERGGQFLVLKPLTIAPRAWRIEHVDAPFHPPAMPDETFAALRKAELARIDAARMANAPSEGWRQNFIWPGKGRISGLFGSQRTYRGGEAGSYHSGTDIALSGGTPYLAPADGVVTLAADHPFTLEGNLLMLDHGMGLTSAFLHSSALLVKEGDRVAQSQPIGRVGMSGRATGPHLHWSMRWREARLDPMLFAGPMV